MIWKFVPPLALLCLALPLLSTARAATPTAPATTTSSYVTHAQSLMAQGDLKGALNTLDEYLATAPQDASARFEKGLVLTRMGRTQDAMQIFTALTQDYPQLPEPYNNLAVLYAKQGQYDKARDALKAALATHPSYATAAENLGDVYAAMAARAYDHALQLDKSNQQVRDKLALISRLNAPPASSLAGQAAAAPVAAAPAVTPTATSRAPASAAAESASSAAPHRPQVTPPVPTGSQKAVAAAVESWAAAWSRQDVPGYVSHYARDFKGDDASHAAWARERGERIASPAHISVRVLQLKVTMQGADTAQAAFTQRYESDTYNDTVHKVLRLKRMGGAWKIVDETTH